MKKIKKLQIKSVSYVHDPIAVKTWFNELTDLVKSELMETVSNSELDDIPSIENGTKEGSFQDQHQREDLIKALSLARQNVYWQIQETNQAIKKKQQVMNFIQEVQVNPNIIHKKYKGMIESYDSLTLKEIRRFLLQMVENITIDENGHIRCVSSRKYCRKKITSQFGSLLFYCFKWKLRSRNVTKFTRFLGIQKLDNLHFLCHRVVVRSLHYLTTEPNTTELEEIPWEYRDLVLFSIHYYGQIFININVLGF